MAFSDAEKALIRQYLGYADIFRYQNPRLEGVLTKSLSPEAEDLVRTHMASLVEVEKKIISQGIATAGLQRADDIWFYRGSTYIELRNWGRIYCGRISIILGVPIYSDIFSPTGYLGDSFSQFGLASGRGSNIIPLG